MAPAVRIMEGVCLGWHALKPTALKQVSELVGRRVRIRLVPGRTSMWNSFFVLVFYAGAGLVLIAAGVWYVSSLYTYVTGTGELVIAPFEIVLPNGTVDRSIGVALAHGLQAKLGEIETGIALAQKQLVRKPPESRAAVEPRVAQLPALAPPVPNIQPVLVQGVGLRTKLLDPADIKVSVAGVEVGQVVPWLQRQLAVQRTVVFTVYQKKQAVSVTGSLGAMGLQNDALVLEVKADPSEQEVPLDRVVEQMAYEITRLRLAADPENHLEALDGGEFQTLVGVLRETARLNLKVENGRTAPVAFQELLQTASRLAESVDGWYQLDNLAASIAESAKDWDAALKFYKRTRSALPETTKFAELRAAIDGKIAEVDGKRTVEAAPVPAAGPSQEEARLKMVAYVKEATEFFNAILGQKMKPPIVKLQTDPAMKFSPYYDADKTIVAAEDVQYLPDLTFRNTAWQHLLALTGIQIADDDATDIIYSANDILTTLMHQHYLKQDAASSDWKLAKGFVEWIKGQKLTKPFEGTPWINFAAPGTAYEDPTAGKDRQVAHVRNRSTKQYERMYINSGIFDKAFYLVAKDKGSDRAGEIWIGALRQVKKARGLDYQRFARMLFDNAGQDKDVVKRALAAVGLDVEKPTRAESTQ
jgi:Thermolysin metallopeptidase, alpha-helical domain